jgi:hypothetical protein
MNKLGKNPLNLLFGADEKWFSRRIMTQFQENNRVLRIITGNNKIN